MAYRTIYRANRARALAYLGGKCIECGSVERLEFDHINNDRQDATHKITSMLRYSWEKLLVELGKCQLLCRPCHNIKTAEDRGFKSDHAHGTLTRYSYHKCRCSECRGARAAYMREHYRRKKLLVAA